MFFPPGGDETARWWAAVIGVAVHWLSGDDKAAEALSPILDTFPKSLQDLE